VGDLLAQGVQVGTERSRGAGPGSRSQRWWPITRFFLKGAPVSPAAMSGRVGVTNGRPGDRLDSSRVGTTHVLRDAVDGGVARRDDGREVFGERGCLADGFTGGSNPCLPVLGGHMYRLTTPYFDPGRIGAGSHRLAGTNVRGESV